MRQTSQQKVRIKMKSFDAALLERSALSIQLTIKKSGAPVGGPVFLPRKCQRFTVNSSTHVDKKARDQFEIRYCSRVLFLRGASVVAMQLLEGLQLPAGVCIEIKQYEGSEEC